MLNKNLLNAQKNKNDEFYTYYEDIEKELTNYKQFLENKTVYLPCDNPAESNFYKFFKNNFKNLKLKKILCTYYRADGSNSYLTTYDGKCETVEELDNCGDFLDVKNLKYYKEADVVITNPPFSLFRDFIDLLFSMNKDFILVSLLMHMSYKNTFYRFKDGLIRFGYNNNLKFFNQTEENLGVTASRWITTFKIKKEYKTIECNKTYTGNEEYFKKYENSNIINVDKLKEIPGDYSEEIGVPITIFDYYNPNTKSVSASCIESIKTTIISKNKKNLLYTIKLMSFELVDLINSNVDGIKKFKRISIQEKEE